MRTNHITEGETHVPALASDDGAKAMYNLRETFGEAPFTLVSPHPPWSLAPGNLEHRIAVCNRCTEANC
eukprot:7361244-Pyramimonas_sp.AAC.1